MAINPMNKNLSVLTGTIIIFLFICSIIQADELTDIITGKGKDIEKPAENKLITTDNSARDDRKIHKRLREIYSELDDLQKVSTSVSNGVVTLTGEVDSLAKRERALQFAHQVEGVVEVQDKLEVNRSLQIRLKNSLKKIKELIKEVIASLPLLLLALTVLILFWIIGSRISRHHAIFRRITPNYFIASLIGQLVHLIFIFLGIVLSLVLLDATELLGTVLGAAGIVGLAVGFAVRDTVENYIASILLSLRNPFEMNDMVSIDGHMGNVVKLTSRATIIITADGNHTRIPNALVFKAVIVNYTRNMERRFEFDVGIDTEQNLQAAQKLALNALMSVDGVMSDPPAMAIIQELGDSNVIIRVYGWVDQQNYGFLKVRSEAIRVVKENFDQAGIVMPEPIYKLRIMGSALNISTNETAVQKEPQPKRVKATLSTDDDPIGDVSPDRSIEKKVLAEQFQQDKDDNLLSPDAPKEI